MEERDSFTVHQVKSFYHGFIGIYYNIKTQVHFRFHLIAAIVVIIMGILYKITFYEWLIVTLLITAIMAAEAMNTAIEETCNLLHPDIHPHARMAKHSAAASVLILSIGALIIGAIIFTPKIFG
jgi:diacylglycerol kinase